MSTRSTLAALALAFAPFVPSSAAQDCAGDPGFGITLLPATVALGQPFDECLSVPPGSWTVYLVPSFFAGTLPTQFGPLCVAPPFINIYVLPMPVGGELCLGERQIPCEPSYVGVDVHFQFVAVSADQPGLFGRSNLATLSLVDGPCGQDCWASIGDFVFVDTDGDDLQDPGEPGLPGVTLRLKNEAGDVLATTITDGDGRYVFEGLCAGSYLVEVDPTSVPAGHAPVACEAGTDAALDGNCQPALVVLPDDGAGDDSIDFGYRATPGLSLTKTADAASIAPYESVLYTYLVTNTGGTTLTNVVVEDDACTPGHAADDLVVGTIASLAPGASATLQAELIPPVCTGAVVKGKSVTAGTVLVSPVAPDGTMRVTYLQAFGINDNTYGSGVIGWPGSNHKFKHLTGSDKLQFRFHDANGVKVLDFHMDYLSASSAFPSGFGSLGPFGGDGELLFGSAGHVVSFTSSLAENLNHPANVPFKAGLTTNSPTALVAGNVVVDAAQAPGGWNHVNAYSVVIQSAAFGASGFGSVAIPDQHNSPSKLDGPDGLATQPKNSTVVNTARATAQSPQGPLVASASASVDIVASAGAASCKLEVGCQKFDKKEVSVTIKNKSAADVVLSSLALGWPAGNGKLLAVKLDGDVVWSGPAAAPPNLSLAAAQLVSDPAKRTIKAGTSDVLKLVFEKNVDKDPQKYGGSQAGFGAGCSTLIP